MQMSVLSLHTTLYSWGTKTQPFLESLSQKNKHSLFKIFFQPSKYGFNVMIKLSYRQPISPVYRLTLEYSHRSNFENANWRIFAVSHSQCQSIIHTHVPRISLNSNIFLMSSTCFFHDPFTDSSLPLAMVLPGCALPPNNLLNASIFPALQETQNTNG